MSEFAVRVLVSGRVQGVGFRATTQHTAMGLGLAGSAANLADGRVEVQAEGERSACEALVSWLRGPDTPGAVSGVEVKWIPPAGAADFRVR